MTVSELRQHAREHFESQVLLIAQAIGPALEHADLVVQPLHEAEGHFVLGMAVGRAMPSQCRSIMAANFW